MAFGNLYRSQDKTKPKNTKHVKMSNDRLLLSCFCFCCCCCCCCCEKRQIEWKRKLPFVLFICSSSSDWFGPSLPDNAETRKELEQGTNDSIVRRGNLYKEKRHHHHHQPPFFFATSSAFHNAPFIAISTYQSQLFFFFGQLKRFCDDFLASHSPNVANLFNVTTRTVRLSFKQT